MLKALRMVLEMGNIKSLVIPFQFPKQSARHSFALLQKSDIKIWLYNKVYRLVI